MDFNNEDDTPTSDPKKVIILLSGDPEFINNWSDSSWLPLSLGGGSADRDFLTDGYSSDPTFIIPGDYQRDNYHLINIIKEYIINNGPIDEIVIDGDHGSANNIYSTRSYVNITQFLQDLEKLKDDPEVQQALNGENPVTKRISFPGCNTFSQWLKPEEIEFLQNYAITNQIDLIGSTTETTTKKINNNGTIGRFIQFSKDGSIVRPSGIDNLSDDEILKKRNSYNDQTKIDCLVKSVTPDSVVMDSAKKALEAGLQCMQEVDLAGDKVEDKESSWTLWDLVPQKIEDFLRTR